MATVENGMKTKILLFCVIGLALLTLGCASALGSTTNTPPSPFSSVTLDLHGEYGVYLDYFGRVIDHEAGVVCWIARTGGYSGAGISCIPLNQTLLSETGSNK